MLPDKIPIARMEDYHTEYIGKCANGHQFWVYQTFVYEKPVEERGSGKWAEFRREYVIRYLFDAKGNFLDARYFYNGYASDLPNSAGEEKIREFLAELEPYSFCDIEVFLFNVMLDGYEFGLMKNEEFDCIDLQPESVISFQEPWDGEYNT